MKFLLLFSAFFFFALPAFAQVPEPDTLKHPIPPPVGGGQPGDLFGGSVAISGSRLVVGSCNDDSGAPDAGSVYVYDLGSLTPTVPVATLNNPSPALGDNFGFSVAISGTRVVVGAYYDDTGFNNAGSAYVYDLSSATPTVPEAVLNNPGPADNDQFGYAVAISGTRVVIGALFDDTAASNAGIAYVYDLSSGTPTQHVAVLNNPAPAAFDLFGNSVAMSEARVVVGTRGDDAGATDAGSAYVYDLDGVMPTVPAAVLNNPEAGDSDYFGTSVAISGMRVVVGADANDAGATINSGSAYVYDLSGGTPSVPLFTLNNPAPAASDLFGRSVAITGTRVVVGAPGDDAGAVNAGSGYVYDVSAGTPALPVATLNKPGPVAGDQFGTAVAIEGASAAIGTPYDDTLASDKGHAYVFGPSNPDSDGDGLLDVWELTHWPTIVGHSALDDFDHDGYCELHELAYDLNPKLSDPGGLPAATSEGGYRTMTIAKRAGVTYEVQSAGTLLPALPNSFSGATTTLLIDDPTMLKVRDNVLVGAPPARFIRVKVTAAP